jgi:hypothetical protein
LRPRLRYFCNVIPLDEEPLKAKIWGFGVQVFDELAGYYEDPEWGDAILRNDIILERSGEGINTEYRIRVSQKSTPIPKEVLADVPNLDEILVPREKSYIEELLSESDYGGALPSDTETEEGLSLPRCFGMFDPADPDCKACGYARRCAKQNAVK